MNSAILMGRLTADPILRTTTNGKSVTTFTVAVDRPYLVSSQHIADYISIVTWEKTAVFVEKYFKKGEMIAVEGSLQGREYSDRNRKKHIVWEVVAREVSFCGNKQNEGEVSISDITAVTGFSNASAADFEEIADEEDF